MNTSEQLVVNKLPTRTWNHLKVNEATIPWNAAETADLGTDTICKLQQKTRHSRCISDLTGAEGHSRKRIAVEVAAGVQATVYMVLDTQGSFAVETALDAPRPRVSAPCAGARRAGAARCSTPKRTPTVRPAPAWT